MVMFAYKSWRSYRHTNNPLARIYFWITTTLSVAFVFFGLPPLFTENTHVLKYTYFMADLFVQLSMQAMAWLVWYVGLRGTVRLRTVILFTSLLSLCVLIAQLLTSQAFVSQAKHLVVYTDQMPALILKSLIYLSVGLPLGYFMLRQVGHQLSLRAKAKSFLAGIIFIVVSGAATYNNIFDKGSDTVGSTLVLAVIFLSFLIVSALPHVRSEARPQSNSNGVIKSIKPNNKGTS